MAARTYAKIFIYFPLYLLVFISSYTLSVGDYRLIEIYINFVFFLLVCVYFFLQRTQGVPQGMTKNRVNLWRGVVGEKVFFNMRVRDHF